MASQSQMEDENALNLKVTLALLAGELHVSCRMWEFAA